MSTWEFAIDVGGTFTDCVARSPEGVAATCKVLSSGVTKGRIGKFLGRREFLDPLRIGEPVQFWRGYRLTALLPSGEMAGTSRVADSDPREGRLTLDDDVLAPGAAGWVYELHGPEEAPVLAIRRILGLRLDQPIPQVSVRLGTTRGTNALLTRRGARTAFVTTRGFADILKIANQDRPRLFDLAIRKPEPLFECVVEIDERLDAQGQVLRPADASAIAGQMAALRAGGFESIAICLMHAYANPVHEELVERLAREAGFTEVSTSSRLAPLIKIVSRGDTTVADAYLNPVLRAYVRGLERPLSGSRLRLMTSAGGLVSAAAFVGKDSILSGPAGGVMGFSRVARRAGFEKSIGFDMGGTSTDVSRFDGRYDLEYETQKAGVRVVAPMLAIETVAAGGGSICRFDGVKLVVGPESAGADPGPACYGRGGPLTITDVNLYLGRVVSERFPFPLAREAVGGHLEQLCRTIESAGHGNGCAPVELAMGFVSIANANMVRAIRNISVAKGYDPRDYALVTFGGAGGQHACALARELGMRHVLSHPMAGLLSAYGIGVADVRRFGEQAVLRPLAPETLEETEAIFARLEDRARRQILDEGLSRTDILPAERSFDMRYRGAESTINVPLTGEATGSLAQRAAACARRYEELHQQLYGYRHEGRGIEIVAARVEVVGRMAEPYEEELPEVPRRATPARYVRAWFDQAWRETELFEREQLRPGDAFEGPAIVCEPTSTLVVEPGFRGRVLARGEVLLTDAGGAAQPAVSIEADPVMLEIFNNQFASIAEQMGITLRKTSFSTNVKERLDFSCAIFDSAGDLVVNAPHIPVHLGAMAETVKRVLADNPAIAPGDVYATNDPYRGGSHLPDVTVITPVHDAATGRLAFLTASRAHHAEIGGIVPGSMPPFSTNLAEEGVLIRNFKLVDAGRPRFDELERLLLSGPYPTRAVRDNLADVAAQVAANTSGATGLWQLVERYSLEVVEAYMRHIQRAAERKMRSALAAIPDGTYRFTDHLDGGAPVAVAITVAGDSATVDFTGTGPVLRAPATQPNGPAPAQRPVRGGGYNLNANRAIVSAAILYVFRCLIREEIPLNGGVLLPVRLVLPTCLLNPPEEPDPAQCAAMVGGNVETSQRVVDVLLGALGLAAASQGTMNNFTFGDDTFGYYETICGGSGATPDADGADAVHTHMTNTRLTDPEVLERRYPVRILEFSIRRGSGGRANPPAGAARPRPIRRGGDGVARRIEFLAPLRVSILSERRGPFAPFGLNGGPPGALGRNTLIRASSGVPEPLPGKVQLEVAAGDVICIETPGGGAMGGGTQGA